MNAPEATLRQITEAIGQVRAFGDEERERLYSRARTMRDRGLILTANARQQGREIKYSGADIAAAVVAINISLNGGSTGQIESINNQLRPFDNPETFPAFEANFDRIVKGEPVFVRLDFISHPWTATHARMGTFAEISLTDKFEWVDDYQHLNVITQTNLLPVTTLVLPVLAAIAES